MNDNDTFAFEDRNYVSPTVSRDEQLDFIKTLREIQNNNYQRIESDTHNLGTDVTPNLGGLTGAGVTWNNRYVKPQVDSTVAKLNAVAQETALNQSLENLKAQYKKRYNDAYRNAKNRAKTTGGGGGTTKDVPVNVTDDTRSGSGYVSGVPGAQSVVTPDGIVHDVYPDGTVKEYYGGVTYKNPPMAAGASDVTDIFTGKYNYSLPNGIELELGGNNEQLKMGSDGNYYIWNTANNSYTQVTGDSGNNSKNGGQSRWWKK